MARLMLKVPFKSISTSERLDLIHQTSRQIFGHFGSHDSPWGSHRILGNRSPRPYFHGTIISDQPFSKFHAEIHRFWLSERYPNRLSSIYDENEENQDEKDPISKFAETLKDDENLDEMGDIKVKTSKKAVKTKDDSKQKKKMV